MALLIPDEKCCMLHHETFSLSSKQTQQALIRNQWCHLQLIQPHCLLGKPMEVKSKECIYAMQSCAQVLNVVFEVLQAQTYRLL